MRFIITICYCYLLYYLKENIVNMLNQPNNCTIYEVVVRKFLCRRYSAYPPIPIQIMLTKAEG